MKKFNTTGLCASGTHYMVDISGKIEEIMKLVDSDDLHIAATFGYVKEKDKKAAISNRIFEILLLDYFVSSDEKTESLMPPAGQGLYHDITT